MKCCIQKSLKLIHIPITLTKPIISPHLVKRSPLLQVQLFLGRPSHLYNSTNINTSKQS